MMIVATHLSPPLVYSISNCPDLFLLLCEANSTDICCLLVVTLFSLLKLSCYLFIHVGKELQ